VYKGSGALLGGKSTSKVLQFLSNSKQILGTLAKELKKMQKGRYFYPH